MKNSPWLCPHCRESFDEANSGQLKCSNNHAFDLAKQGYVNLLPANKKKSSAPGDSVEMLQARRTFLDAGNYDILVLKIFEAILFNGETADISILDIGCGEGYYARQLAVLLKSAEINALDISKCGIKMAASSSANTQLDNNMSFAVASSFSIPLPDNSIDIALSVFSPVCESELKRILKPGGLFIRVLPGAYHLIQIKSQLYKKAQTHRRPHDIDQMSCIYEESVYGYKELSKNNLELLLTMTPLQWHGNREKKLTMLENDKALEVDFHFIVQGFRCD